MLQMPEIGKSSRAKKDLIENINQKDIFQELSIDFLIKDLYLMVNKMDLFCNTRYNVMKHMLKDNMIISSYNKPCKIIDMSLSC